ncbi:MAG: NEW3 domain-containing protein, partial [Gemmatimonadaceae bacterium]
MSRRSALLTATAVAFVATAAAARAQDGKLELRATSAAETHADAGSVVTSVFAIKNTGADTVHALPALSMPKGWSVVMGAAPVVLAPGAADTWLVGISIPASAPAGGYVVRSGLAAGGMTPSDSTVIYVNERRALEVLPIDLPTWVMAGARYESRFIVRNRGNVESTISLSGATSRGTRVETMPESMTLAPGASATATVRIAIANIYSTTTDDVAELTAS